MDFTFLRSSGEVAFFRNDAEQADWTQEEMTISCIFPYNPDKVIERGMVILFQDPATNDWQAQEVRQCSVIPGDAYQQVSAEDLAISELSDCHIPETIEFSSENVSIALAQVLSETGWEVGRVEDNPTSFGDVTRGTVWDAVNVLSRNWNVYITPRVEVSSAGIVARYLDITSSEGFDRGLRLSINKNTTDPAVIYDDTELYTALYGYGGTYTEGSGSSSATLEYNFASVVWNKTSQHPAKPEGQKYLEDPEATALYGRNGKPRFGFYQNAAIDDPEILLQKTWESLQQCNKPKISISGTVTDLKRFGYADVPVRLHDMAIVELEPVGLQFYLQIIKNTVDLLDATNTRPTIGDYIPTIIYINRETEKAARGGGGGGGRGPSSMNDLEMEIYETKFYDTGRQIGMWARVTDANDNILRQAGLHIDPDTGVLVYAEDNEKNIGSMFHVQSDRITAEVNARTAEGRSLSSRITQNANSISLEVAERKGAINGLNSKIEIQKDRISLVVTDGSNPQIKPASIVQSINSSGSNIQLSADHIDIDGLVNQLRAKNIGCANLTTQNNVEVGGHLSTDGYIYAGTYVWADSVRVGGSATGATWQTYTARKVTLSSSRYTFPDSGGVGHYMYAVTGYSDETLYYLGRT